LEGIARKFNILARSDPKHVSPAEDELPDFFNSKVEIQVALNNKYNKICTLRGSDPMPEKKAV